MSWLNTVLAGPRRTIVLSICSICLLCLLSGRWILGSQGQTRQQVNVNQAVLEDFSDIVTVSDLGFNDFSGNVGASNKAGINYGQFNLELGNNGSPRLRFNWDFNISSDPLAFTGLFFSVFGLTDTLATFDGQTPGDFRRLKGLTADTELMARLPQPLTRNLMKTGRLLTMAC